MLFVHIVEAVYKRLYGNVHETILEWEANNVDVMW